MELVRKGQLSVAALFALNLTAPMVLAATTPNIVGNPGIETSTGSGPGNTAAGYTQATTTFPGFPPTTSFYPEGINPFPTPTPAISGNYDLFLNNTVAASNVAVSQNTSVANGANGLTSAPGIYTLSFNYQDNFAAGGIGQYILEFYSPTDALTSPSYNSNYQNFPGASSGVVSYATTSSIPTGDYAVLIFIAGTGAGAGSASQIAIDNISLTTPTTATPEPASLGVLGAVGAGLLRRRAR